MVLTIVHVFIVLLNQYELHEGRMKVQETESAGDMTSHTCIVSL